MAIDADDLALGWLTVGGTDPFVWLSAARAAGFGHLGVKVAPRPGEPVPVLLDDHGLRREFKAECDRAGIRLLNMGSIWLDGAVALDDYAQALDIGAELGVPYAIGISIDPDPDRRVRQMLTLASMVQERGMRLAIEFFAYSAIPDFRQAQRIVEQMSPGQGGILFDALHFHRSGGLVSELAPDDFKVVEYFQLCDAPRSLPASMTLSDEGRSARLFPGEGDIPLKDMMALMPETMLIEVEIPHRLLRDLSPDDRAREAMRQSLSFLKGV